MRTSSHLIFIITLATLLCVGCGYRDALYLPKPTIPHKTPINTISK